MAWRVPGDMWKNRGKTLQEISEILPSAMEPDMKKCIDACVYQANTLLDPFGEHKVPKWSLTETADYLENEVKPALNAAILSRYSPGYAGLSSTAPLSSRYAQARLDVDQIVIACRKVADVAAATGAPGGHDLWPGTSMRL